MPASASTSFCEAPITEKMLVPRQCRAQLNWRGKNGSGSVVVVDGFVSQFVDGVEQDHGESDSAEDDDHKVDHKVPPRVGAPTIQSVTEIEEGACPSSCTTPDPSSTSQR